MTLQDLLTRVEAASGPDREIDVYIALWQGWTLHTDEADPVYRGVVSEWWKDPADKDWSTTSNPPDYTASIDAAVALVEKKLPGWIWWVSATPSASLDVAEARAGMPYQRVESNNCATPPLALLAALLKALIAREQTRV